VADIPYGRIFRVDSDGQFELFTEYDGWPNALAFHKDGRLFIADHFHGIMVCDLATRQVSPLLTRFQREGFKGINDLVFASNGDLYFTDQGQTGLQDPSGRVFRLRRDGQVDCLLKNIPSPNGLVLTPDEKTILVAVTRANQIWRLPLHSDGTTSKVSIFIQLSGGLAGPDGLAMDSKGNLAIAHCGLGCAWFFSRLGEPVLRINTPAGLSSTNLAFCPSDPRQLVITESDSGSLYRVNLPEPGLMLFSHQT
jgi:gluconolactonase